MTPAPCYETLLVRPDEGVLHVTLNRPEARNAMTLAMVRELKSVLADAQSSGAARIVVLRGAGGHFCAGADLKDMAAAQARARAPDDRDRPAAAPAADPLAEINASFGELCLAYAGTGLATVAVLEGTVIGGGLGLACVADVATCARRLRLSYALQYKHRMMRLDTPRKRGVSGLQAAGCLPPQGRETTTMNPDRHLQALVGALYAEAADADPLGILTPLYATLGQYLSFTVASFVDVQPPDWVMAACYIHEIGPDGCARLCGEHRGLAATHMGLPGLKHPNRVIRMGECVDLAQVPGDTLGEDLRRLVAMRSLALVPFVRGIPIRGRSAGGDRH